jgi:hypothetical protein
MVAARRRFSVQITDANGVSQLMFGAFWTEEERRKAFAQIERLADLPQVNVYSGPASLEPEPKRRAARRSAARLRMGQ